MTDGGSARLHHVARPTQPVVEPHRVGDTGADLEAYIFGTLDGLVTNLAVVAGVVAAGFGMGAVAIAGIAAMFAGAVSMFVGAYVSSHARWELAQREKRREEEEVEHVPDIEKAEVREIFEKWGFPEAEARAVTERIAMNKELWVDFMMQEELGFTRDDLKRPPKRHGAIIGFAYLIGSLIPLLPFLFVEGWMRRASSTWDSLVAAIALGCVALAVLGAYKERFGGERPVWGGLQMVGIGLGAAAAVYLVTYLITSFL
ncbi:MAG: VIT1/CCC1 transporter family protein [Euryarchaeota archaeon]|nr:VIT1/CCC1 transporter family protein [Euryarchaeota archaeon]MDE1837833.1 VIT1/CCC1 transporter family protein [Euryarchaeota archaeon]MDE1880107.1 VIT1/CCC1 transporter family protein [Euryarchaeota archaeon]MDE2045055.1 VIT1/CCC1 transporter family protein [Thermoplasmata archaeon]